MPAEHYRPDGLYAGYYCMTCGDPGMSMYGSKYHGHGKCDPRPEIVAALKELNKKVPDVKP